MIIYLFRKVETCFLQPPFNNGKGEGEGEGEGPGEREGGQQAQEAEGTGRGGTSWTGVCRR